MNDAANTMKNSLHLLITLLIGLTWAAPADAQDGGVVQPFNGENLQGWHLGHHADHKSHWTAGEARISPEDPRRFAVERDGSQLINADGHGVNIYSDYRHGDAVIELDVMVPKGANSGIFVQGEYEVQVLDSYGDQRVSKGDMGAIYGVAEPRDPRYKAPGEWQHYRLVFQAPRFNQAGEKVENAKFVKVVLNGRTIHENVEMKGPTPGGLTGEERPRGPLMLQGDHGPVAYRNITIRPIGLE